MAAGAGAPADGGNGAATCTAVAWAVDIPRTGAVAASLDAMAGDGVLVTR